MSLVGDRERDRVAASLRRHYLHGRLSLEELADRVHVALAARSRADLRAALRDLPPSWRDVDALAAPVARTVTRAATFVALAGVWLFFSLVLLISFAVAALFGGPSATETLVFVLGWVGLTYGVWRVWQRGSRRG